MDPNYDDESSPSEAGGMGADSEPANKEESTPEHKLALVQTSLFDKAPKPGDREMVEIVDVYENEVSIKCVTDYDEEKEEATEAPMSDQSAPAQAEDAMMA